MAWTYWVCDTITGEKLHEIRPVAATWNRRMNASFGRGEVTLLTDASEFKAFTAATWGDILKPDDRVIAHCWNDTPIYSGTVGRITQGSKSNVLKIQTHEIGRLLSRRLYFGASSYSKTASLSFSNLTRQGMLIEVLKHVAGGGYGAAIEGSYPWRLPIHFEAAGAGSWSRTTMQHEFESPWSLLTQITQEDGGPDFVLEPGFGTGTDGVVGHQWRCHVGNPTLERSVHRWDVSAERSPIDDPQVVIDPDERATGVFVLGKGSGSDMIVGRATPAVGGPRHVATDVALSEKDVTDANRASGLASQKLSRRLEPSPQWELAGVDAAVALAGMNGDSRDGIRPGSRVVLNRDLSPVLEAMGVPVTTEQRVVGMSGDKSDKVRLEVQPL